MKEKIDGIENNKNDIDDLNEKSQENQQNDSLIEKLNQLENELKKAKKNNKKLNNKNNQLKNQIQKNNEQNEQYQKILTQLKEEIKEKDIIIEKLNDLNSNINSKDENQQQILIINELNSELENARIKNNDLLLINQQKEETIEQLRIELQNKQNRENEIDVTLEITDEVKQQIEQRNLVNLNDPNNKYERNFHTFQMCINDQPVCIAIGDIEGDIEKLRPIYNLIKANPKLNFVFIDDLFDDLSDSHEFSDENWDCLYLLSEFFICKDNISFAIDNVNTDDSKICLPSAFQNIVFEEAEFEQIHSQVKFIAGNSE